MFLYAGLLPPEGLADTKTGCVISVEQSLGGVIIVVVKYFYMPSFFKKAKFSNSKALPAIKSGDFESVLLNGVANLTGAKGILVSCFNLKKIYSIIGFKKLTDK